MPRKMSLSSLLLLLLAIPVTGGGGASFVHSGTPAGVPPDSDCAIRNLAYEYGKKLMPERGDFKSLFDALQLEVCGKEEDAESQIQHSILKSYRPHFRT